MTTISSRTCYRTVVVNGTKIFFREAGSAEAFKRDLPKAQVRFFDTGHFALETHCQEIADAILPFLENVKP
jgi:pimeloyl-ACP methyl ester carboxylesterase